MRRRTLIAASVGLAMAGSAGAALDQRAPVPLTGAVTLQCDAPLVTATDEAVPRTYLAGHSALADSVGGFPIYTNNASHYSVLGPRSFWWNRKVCARASLPKRLPPARLVRIARANVTCVVPGRRLLVHAARKAGANSLSVRALPHGQLLLRVELQGESVRAYASRYAVRRCDFTN